MFTWSSLSSLLGCSSINRTRSVLERRGEDQSETVGQIQERIRKKLFSWWNWCGCWPVLYRFSLGYSFSAFEKRWIKASPASRLHCLQLIHSRDWPSSHFRFDEIQYHHRKQWQQWWMGRLRFRLNAVAVCCRWPLNSLLSVLYIYWNSSRIIPHPVLFYPNYVFAVQWVAYELLASLRYNFLLLWYNCMLHFAFFPGFVFPISLCNEQKKFRLPVCC